MISSNPHNKVLSVSVVMSIYNEPEKWLRESIDSILNQTFKDFEFIIINDNPKRQLNDTLLNEYQKKDSRVVIIKNETNIGLTKSLNKGLKRAKGEYIARMDGDDISMSKRFEKQYEYMENNQETIACGTNVFLAYNNKIKTKKYPENSDSCKKFLFFNSCFAHPSVMVRAKNLKESGLSYNPSYLKSQDYDLWCKLSKYGDFYNIQETLLKYRISDKQISSVSSKSQNTFARTIRKNYFLGNISSPHVIRDISTNNITITTLKKNRNVLNDKWRLFPIYMSIKNKNLSAFIYFIISMDIIRLPIKYSLITIKRFLFSTNATESYL